jgi:hypothetical protein
VSLSIGIKKNVEHVGGTRVEIRHSKEIYFRKKSIHSSHGKEQRKKRT